MDSGPVGKEEGIQPMIENHQDEQLFNDRFDMALELTAAADVDLAEAIDILDSVNWDYGRAVRVTAEKEQPQ